MDRQEILYLILGIALGSIFTSILLLRAPLVSQRAYDLGLRMKDQTNVSAEAKNQVEKGIIQH